MVMRVDLYTFVHKAQRFHMFRLSEAIGSADLSQAEEAAEISKQVLELMEHLKDHAQNEKKYIHPLYQKVGSVDAHFDREHENLESEIHKIEKIVQEKNWSELYATYAKFVGVYLLHIDEEEAAQREVLWKNYEDAILGATFMRFKAERPPHLAKKDFELMLPALSIPELTQVFRGMKASAPAQAFQGACDAAARLLAKNRWDKINAAIT
jgi:hemerythrin superfamily protein